MPRLAALSLLGALVASGLVAAPAPFPRPDRAGPWVTGWDTPVDPVGDCRFDRDGDKLTITVPGSKGRSSDFSLLRDVEGDFVLQVRMAVSFPGAAGILLVDGKQRLQVTLAQVGETTERHLLIVALLCQMQICESPGRADVPAAAAAGQAANRCG
jgi:hypothetical protein